MSQNAELIEDENISDVSPEDEINNSYDSPMPSLPEEPEEIAEEAPKPAKDYVSGKYRINQLERQKHQAEARVNQLMEENERLRQTTLTLNKSLETSNNAAYAGYEQTVNLSVAQAKQSILKAKEEGDVQAELEALEALASAKASEKSLQDMKLQQQINANRKQEEANYYQQMQQTSPPPAPPLNTDTYYEWLEGNSWYDKDSDEYNPKVANVAKQYATQLDQYLQRNGRTDLILSPDYFKEIDLYMEQQNPRRQPQMTQSRNGVSSARRSNSSPMNSRSNDLNLSPEMLREHEEMRNRFGVSKELYEKRLREDIEKQRQKRESY